MGIFAEWQPRYAEHGITTFPLNGKKPALDHYQKLGLRGSQQLTFRFPDHDALAFMCGSRNAITVLDVDTSDERVLADALARHGATPFVVRSGGGNYQAWYRNGGERRQIRPWGKDVPIDVLGGGGQVVAPPSRGARGAYRIIQGDLDDLRRLPRMGGLARRDTIISNDSGVHRDVVAEGKRNKSLWDACMRRAHKCGGLNELMEFAHSRNAEFGPPLPNAEVAKVALSAWGYTERGENWFGRGEEARVGRDTVRKLAACHPDAMALLLILKINHEGTQDFVLANAMADKTLCWPLRRFRAARAVLEHEGIIRCVHPGGRGQNDPPIYTWA
jgi:Bifunctional DNA primase/polymerase, N-terminal